MFRSNLFGVAALVGPDGPLGGRATQRHRLGLVALLTVAGPRGMARERLGHLLWPDAESDKAARRLLSDSIYRVNQAVGEDAIVTEGEAVRLDRDRLPSDLGDFAMAMEQEAWETAVEIQHAPFLDGFVLPSAPFERWAESERRRLHQDRQKAIETLAEAAEGADPSEATRWWRLAGAGDRFSSRVALRLMHALDAQGDRAAAVQHAQTHAALVRDELGLEPDIEVLRFAEELRTAPIAPISQRPDRPAQKDDNEQAPFSQSPVGRVPRRRVPTVAWAGTAVVTAAVLVGIPYYVSDPDAGVPAPPSSIVVLPFADNSPGSDQEYFADGVTDELIARLSAVEGLRVVGRTSAFALKGRAVDARQIGRELSVGAVLEGSVRRAADRLRVSAQLVDAADGFELWSETFEREMTDVLDIQDEIARAIVDRLTGTAMNAAPNTVLSTEDAEAFNLYLSGRFEWHKRSAAGLARSVELFEEALDRAPDFARAHAGLGDAYAVLGFYDYLAPTEAFPKAVGAARRATELGPELAEPYATLGYAALYYEWDAIESERWFRQTLRLNAGYSTGHQWYGNLLVASARFDEAAREMRIAQSLDPLSRIASGALGFVLYMAEDQEGALRQLRQTLELDPDFEVAHLWMGAVHESEGRLDEAVRSYRRATELSAGAVARASLARGLALSGDRVSALEILRDLEREAEQGYAPAYEIAKVHEALGDRDATLAGLNRAVTSRSHSLVFLAIDPQLKGLRGDPEFQALVDRVPVARLARERLGW